MTDDPAPFIGRFADPNATTTIDFPGGCRCPGRPHVVDQAVIRTQIGDGEAKALLAVGVQAGGGLDWEAMNDEIIARFTVSWNLLFEVSDGEGRTSIEPVPITARMASLMDEDSRAALLTAFNEWRARKGIPLPKASGGRSRGSSRANGSRTRTTKRRS